MKDGHTHLNYKAENAIDLDTEIILATEGCSQAGSRTSAWQMKSRGIGIGENWRAWPNTSFGFNISRTWNGRHASVYRTCHGTQPDYAALPASIAGPGGQAHLATRGRGKIFFPSGNSRLDERIGIHKTPVKLCYLADCTP